MSQTNTIKLLCDKIALIARYAVEGFEQKATSGMTDIAEELATQTENLMLAKMRNPKLRFDEMSLAGGMSLALTALQKKDFSGLASALTECVRPELEQVLTQLEEEPVSDAEAAAWAEDLDARGGDQVVCMFGYGDGACYNALCIRQQMTGAKGEPTYIVFEPETDSISDLKEALVANVDFYRLESLLVCCHPGYDKIFATEYSAFLHAINENRERILVNRNTLSRFKDSASKNVITNLHMLKHFNLVSDLTQILPREVPVIIVSAGPSLDKNIELLKKAKGHCLIFAVDTAMKYLMGHDIMPDLGITVEPIKPMANYEDDRIFDVPHIFDCESNPEIVSRERGRIFVYNCRDYVKNLLQAAEVEVPANVPSGGSVATAAFAVCCELGMKTIILIGQDLAYQGTATHAGGVESAGINGDISYDMLDGVDGEPVRTRSDWKGYLSWFENEIRNINEQKLDITVIDATEGGALIHGSHVMSLKTAIDRYCLGTWDDAGNSDETATSAAGKAAEDAEEKVAEKAATAGCCDYNFAEALKHLPYTLDAAKYEQIASLIDKSFEELDEVRTAALEAVEICDTAIKDNSFTDNDIRRLADLRSRCEAALMYPLINNYAVSDIIDEVARIRNDAADKLGGIKQQRLAFDAIVGACEYFQKVP